MESRKNGVLLPRTCAELRARHRKKRGQTHGGTWTIRTNLLNLLPISFIRDSLERSNQNFKEIITCSCWISFANIMYSSLLLSHNIFFRHSIGFQPQSWIISIGGFWEVPALFFAVHLHELFFPSTVFWLSWWTVDHQNGSMNYCKHDSTCQLPHVYIYIYPFLASFDWSIQS